MCKGKSVYHGPPQKMLSHFTMQGYHCEVHDNPADFVLDVLIDVGQKPDDLEKMNQAYWKFFALREELSNPDSGDQFLRLQKTAAIRPLASEIYYISQRTARNTIRNPALLMAQIVVAIILGLLVGFVFYDMKTTIDPGVQNRLGAIFFIVLTQIFTSVTAIEPLIKERALFIHVSF
jgi:ATP-binding cassette subfamily G (WHITE) protein 2